MLANRRLNAIEEIDTLIKNNRYSLIFVYSDECNVCHAIYPKLADRLSHFEQIKIGTVNANQLKEIVGKFEVYSVPSILFFSDQKEIFREGRFLRLDLFMDQVKNFIYQ